MDDPSAVHSNRRDDTALEEVNDEWRKANFQCMGTHPQHDDITLIVIRKK